MTEATEIVLLKLQNASNIEDANSPAADLWKQGLAIITRQPGFQGHLWSPRVEDPTQFVWTIDWSSVEKHKEFINHAEYKTFVGILAQIFDFVSAPPFFYHVNFTSQDSLKAARSAPVTEITTFNVPSNAPAATKSQLEDAVLELAKFAVANGSHGVAVGWAIEEIDVAGNEGDAAKVKTLECLLGWDSVEQHMKVRDHEGFAPLVGPIRALCCKGRSDMTVFHSKLRN